MPELPFQTCWDAIDAIAVINMGSRTDRRQAFREQNGSYLPADKLHCIKAVIGTELPGYGKAPWFSEATGDRAEVWAGTAGCALSHRKAIETALEKGWKRVMILEDDATFIPSEPGMAMLRETLERLNGAYMLYLGFNRPVPYGHRLSEENGVSLWRVEGATATHAYLLSCEVFPILLNLLPKEENVWEWIATHRAVDTFYRNTLARVLGRQVYAIYPVLFSQGVSHSDIVGHVVDGFSYSCPQPPHELYSRRGVLHCMIAPLRRLKMKLNSWYTLRRARRNGFPGYRRAHE